MLSTSRLAHSFNKLPLRHKILIPFFLIIIFFGSVVSYGTYLLIQEALISTATQRLFAVEEIVYREIKKQEFQLITYASLVKFQQSTGSEDPSDPGFTLRQDQLLSLLSKANVTASVFSLESQSDYGELNDLLHQAVNSDQPRFRFISGEHVPALLSVATPLSSTGKNSQNILILQSAVDNSFLKQIVTPFSTDATLLNLEQSPLVTTTKNFTPQKLTAEQIEQLANGEKITLTVKNQGYHRQLYSAIPIGNSEILYLAIDLPLSELEILMDTLATRAGMTILVAIVIGAILFIQLIKNITIPLKTLLKATQEIGEGNLGYRIEGNMSGEFHQLAENFNQMLCKVDNLYHEKAEQEKNLALATEQLHFKDVVEAKNHEIERTNQELRIQLRENSMLLQLNQVMNSTLETNLMFERTLNLLRDFTDCSNLILFLYSPENEELTACKTAGSDPFKDEKLSFKLSEGITGIAAQSKELLYLRDISTDKRYLHYKRAKRDKGSMISAPIVFKGRLLGVLNLHKPMIEAFSEVELHLIKATANQLAIAIENAQLYEQTRLLSNTDELTKISNRRHFQTVLRREFSHAKRYNSIFSVIMIDIDHFKHYNDTYGHFNGDIALKQVAKILLNNTRGIDLVARFGGEEFIVLLSNTNKESAMIVAEKLRYAMSNEELILQDETVVSITISLGVAEYPHDSSTLEALLEKADHALYAAKSSGRNCVRGWHSALNQQEEKFLQINP